jgi:TolA-binding protein
VAAALIRAGECALQLQRKDEADRYFQEVKRNYPGTSWAKEAEKKLGGSRR